MEMILSRLRPYGGSRTRLYTMAFIAATILALAIAIVLFLAAQPGNGNPNGSGSGNGLGNGLGSSDIVPPQMRATSDIGYHDFSWAAASVGDPTTEKPQSKLWFNDGIWWGSLFDRTTEMYYIYRLDWAAQTWSNTGTLIDIRNASRADCLWDGTHLYVATGTFMPSVSGDDIQILRYSYDAFNKAYTLDPGFPVVIGTGVVQGVVLDKDSTGQLWATYTQNNTLYVNRSLNDDLTWGTSFTPAVIGTTLDPDDISSIIAYDSKVGVMWSNQIDDAFYFSFHNDADPDQVWQPSTALLQGTGSADNQINLKTLQGDAAGKLFAAVKTGHDEEQPPNPNADLILLLVLGQNDIWTTHVVGHVADDHTRPIVEIDQEHRELYLIATTAISGTIQGGGTDTAIYYKKSSLDNLSFPTGKGTPLIQGRNDTQINSVTSTKQNLNSASGLVALASDTGTQNYWHSSLTFYTSGSCTLRDFNDVPPASTFYPFVRCLACRNVLGGYPDGSFGPGNNITRGQIAKVVSSAAGFSEDPGLQIFADVQVYTTFYSWINRLTRRGIVSGYPCGGPGEPCDPESRPYFRTGENATRAQISKIVSEAAGFTEEHATQSFEDVPPGTTFYLWIERLASRSVMNGYPCGGPGEPCGVGSRPYFRPNSNVSRGQAAKIVSNTFFPGCQP